MNLMFRGGIHGFRRLYSDPNSLRTLCGERALETVGYHDDPEATTGCVTRLPVNCMVCIAEAPRW